MPICIWTFLSLVISHLFICICSSFHNACLFRALIIPLIKVSVFPSSLPCPHSHLISVSPILAQISCFLEGGTRYGPLLIHLFIEYGLMHALAGILGSSLGGLVSCFAGWTRPHVYTSVGCMSTSFWWNDEDFNNVVMKSRLLSLSPLLEFSLSGYIVAQLLASSILTPGMQV